MVVGGLSIEAVADEEVVSWSSEVVVVGVLEEVFCRHQRIIVEVDVFVRAWETCGLLDCVRGECWKLR